VSPTVDLNSDLGEGFGRWSLGDDDAMLELVTSANVACGFHAGDPNILRRVCDRAAERGVAIGAQVSYRDLAGFGRRQMDVDPDELTNEVVYQIGALDGFARIAGSRVSYVKPHGALYNAAASSEQTASAIVRAVALYDRTLPVLGLAGSVLLAQARAHGLTAVTEAFADRAYTSDGLLVSRREQGAVLHDVEEVAARCAQLVTGGTVRGIDGSTVTVQARSLCVHGDTPGAVAIARAVRRALQDAGVELRPFTTQPRPSTTQSRPSTTQP
jgi:5-oxoprolinase (ATP-hydrolysing) subunit A